MNMNARRSQFTEKETSRARLLGERELAIGSMRGSGKPIKILTGTSVAHHAVLDCYNGSAYNSSVYGGTASRKAVG